MLKARRLTGTLRIVAVLILCQVVVERRDEIPIGTKNGRTKFFGARSVLEAFTPCWLCASGYIYHQHTNIFQRSTGPSLCFPGLGNIPPSSKLPFLLPPRQADANPRTQKKHDCRTDLVLPVVPCVGVGGSVRPCTIPQFKKAQANPYRRLLRTECIHPLRSVALA